MQEHCGSTFLMHVCLNLSALWWGHWKRCCLCVFPCPLCWGCYVLIWHCLSHPTSPHLAFHVLADSGWCKCVCCRQCAPLRQSKDQDIISALMPTFVGSAAKWWWMGGRVNECQGGWVGGMGQGGWGGWGGMWHAKSQHWPSQWMQWQWHAKSQRWPSQRLL